MSERFTQSVESVRAALTRVAFDPAKETLRAFNQRFNDIQDTAAQVLTAREVVDLYVHDLSRGDAQFVRDLVMAAKIDNKPLVEVQKLAQ